MLNHFKSINSFIKGFNLYSCVFLTISIIVLNFKDPRALSKIDVLNYSQESLSKYKWFKVKKSICNDEYNQWMCCDFYFSRNEKIHVVYSDLTGTDPHYIETNLNIYQKKMHIKLNDYLKDIQLDNKYTKLILNDYGDVEIQEFDLINNNKYIHTYTLSCSKLLEDKVNEINVILKNKKKLPKEFENCKVINSNIIKNFDYKNHLLDTP